MIASISTLASVASSASAMFGSEPTLPKLPDSPYFWMPPSASVTTGNTDALWEFMLWMSLFFTVAIFWAMFRFCTKYRAKSRAANEIAQKTSEHNTMLELTWSIIPLLIVVPLFVGGFKGFVDLRTPPKSAMELRATGQKWKWLFTYPGLGTPDDTLHVPVNTPVRMVINSVDVLHSLYIPSFRTKMDAVPGRYTDLWFKATQVGEFPIFCAEYCGTSHSDMITRVVVHPPGEYEKWLAKTIAAADSLTGVDRGKMLYEKQGCSTCHSLDGTPKVGPSWKGIYGKMEAMTGGAPIKVDENYLRESMIDPQAHIVSGFAPAMPTYQGKLSDKDIDGLIEYIKSLK
ncbi:MAG TPA: cytochrome c oxidase subunit II [Polyangiaceae bacterium]|nr:cytochrome c oxidase subunit II [Polyangiaceae bacterium]